MDATYKARALIALLLLFPLIVTLADPTTQSHFHLRDESICTAQQCIDDPGNTVFKFTMYCGPNELTTTFQFDVVGVQNKEAQIDFVDVPMADGQWTCIATSTNGYGEGDKGDPVNFTVVNGQRVQGGVPAAPSLWIE